MEAAVAENVYAGTAMTRRAEYMYGAQLPRNGAGQIGAGLGMTTSLGSIGLIPPTLTITRTGQEETLDGVRIRFQLTPGTECPVEMNFYFPDHRALCMAENATHNLHNLLTLRGAVVRDPRCGPVISTRRSGSSRARPTSPSPRTTGPCGEATASSTTSRSSATCTPISTIRP